MAKPILMSQEGYDNLARELDRLKSTERQAVAEAIREAKSHGDLRENAAYHEAKLNQARLEQRIAELEKSLLSAKIVERPEDAADGSAHLGSMVTLEDLEFGDELVVRLVGSMEADPTHDKISITSPMGEALIGRSAGDVVEVAAPAGTIQYKVLTVE